MSVDLSNIYKYNRLAEQWMAAFRMTFVVIINKQVIGVGALIHIDQECIKEQTADILKDFPQIAGVMLIYIPDIEGLSRKSLMR